MITTTNHHTRSRYASQHGLTIIESVLATVILGISIVAGLKAAAVAAATNRAAAQRIIASQLAADLIQTITTRPYKQAGTSTIGKDGTAETNPGNFNDVDDYNGWTETPPKDYTHGKQLTGLAGWTRSVVVIWIEPSDLNLASTTDKGLKRIHVSVTYQGRVMASAIGFAGGTP